MAKRPRPGRGGHAWRRRLACERAIALPTAVMMLMIILMLAATAGTAAISATGQSSHDRGTKLAVAAADAGLDTAIYRLNKLKPGPLHCVVSGPLYLLLDPILGTGWCPVVSAPLSGASAGSEQLGDGSSFTYTMSAGQNVTVIGQGRQMRKIIATGTANGVSRRIMAEVSTMTGVSAFAGNALTSLKDISLPVGTEIIGGVASNGNVDVGVCPQIVGNTWYGPNKQFTRGGVPHDCPLFTEDDLSQNLILNPVQAAAEDSNDRINPGGGDPFTLRALSSWNPVTRALDLKLGSTLTLTGNTYSFCKLEVKSLAQLIIAPRLPTAPPLKIYIDSPENCLAQTPGMTNSGTMTLSGTGSITNLNTDSDTFQISALGSPVDGDQASIVFGNAISNLIGTIYAPRSEVKLKNANGILGAVAAEKVTLENTARIQWHPSADITLDDLFPLFKRTNWVECSPTPLTSQPDSGC